MPSLCLGVHRLSCVMSAPPHGIAMKLVKSIAYYLADNLQQLGITYGGGGIHTTNRLSGSMYARIDLDAPPLSSMEAFADATHGMRCSHDWRPNDLYGLVIMYAGGCVKAQRKCR